MLYLLLQKTLMLKFIGSEATKLKEMNEFDSPTSLNYEDR